MKKSFYFDYNATHPPFEKILRDKLEEVEDKNPYLALQIKLKIKEKSKELDYVNAVGLT